MGQWNEPIDLGVVEFYWLAIFQPKGFLKVIQFFIAILTFSLTAGFTAVAVQNCVITANNQNTTAVNRVLSPYPFFQYELHANNTVSYADTHIGNGPQFFVCWGVFTMFYCIVAVLVYMFLSKKFVMSGLTSLPDWLVILDLIGTCFWIFMWVLAFLIWAVQSNTLKYLVVNYLEANKIGNCTTAYSLSFAQTDISLTFSFLLIFVWCCNIYFIVKDTSYYIRWSENRKKSYAPPQAASHETY
ncbi:synaptophysin-like protein 1 [Oopsacas minuta]|uniref:Synaptophysin-like protein 1 n=1 Tax=Oopsacas minuta TaxID=111878 RepID=A0AAV7K3I0_9METZ|nr:synaptophysin-like protein 1 [Oopsacas minuta]